MAKLKVLLNIVPLLLLPHTILAGKNITVPISLKRRWYLIYFSLIGSTYCLYTDAVYYMIMTGKLNVRRQNTNNTNTKVPLSQTWHVPLTIQCLGKCCISQIRPSSILQLVINTLGHFVTWNELYCYRCQEIGRLGFELKKSESPGFWSIQWLERGGCICQLSTLSIMMWMHYLIYLSHPLFATYLYMSDLNCCVWGHQRPCTFAAAD